MNYTQMTIAFCTLLRKEIRRFLRIWPQTLLPPAITMTLYFMIFGQIIGNRIGEMAGLSYIQFIIPGLIMMSIITNSYSNVCSSFFSAKFQRSIEELIVSPMSNHVILLGYTIGGVARGLSVGLVVTLMSLFFTDINIHHFFITFYSVFITSLLFSLAGFINALYARSFDDISIIPTFVLTPLTYLGGVFYAISLLPTFWQNISLLNPIVYMVNAFRYGFLGYSDVNVWLSLSVITLCCFGLYALAYHLLKKDIGL